MARAQARGWIVLWVFVLLTALPAGMGLGTGQGPASTAPVHGADAGDVGADPGASLGTVGVHFEPNVGQLPEGVAFAARGASQDVLLLDDGFAGVLRGPAGTAHVVTVTFDGEAPAPPKGLATQPGVSHYLLGDDPGAWHQEVPHHARVVYEEVWPGIDVVFYGTPDGHVEHDFVVAPGADPSAISLVFQGADALAVDASGSLVASTPLGQLVLKAPVAFQDTATVEASYVLADGTARFELGPFDTSRTLVIDPVVVAATYLGGTGDDLSGGVVVDALGFTYLAGSTDSAALPDPLVPGPTTLVDRFDAFVAVLDPTLSALVAITYLGGSGAETATAALLGASEVPLSAPGTIYLAGGTTSGDFPTTPGAYQTAPAGREEGYVALLDPVLGTVVTSTLIGGPDGDMLQALDVDAAGNVYVAGYTNRDGFPTTPEAFQTRARGGWSDAFVAKLGPELGELVYGTMLGGTFNDFAHGLVVDAQGQAHVTGRTGFRVDVNNFPIRDAWHATHEGRYSGFLTVLTADGTDLVFSTYLPGVDGLDLALEPDGTVVLAGRAGASAVTTAGAFQASNAGGIDAYVARFSADGQTLEAATFLGGSSSDTASQLTLHPGGGPVLAWQTSSTDGPLVDPVQATFRGIVDVQVGHLSPDLSSLTFATYWGGGNWDMLGAPYAGLTYVPPRGGVAVDPTGALVVAGASKGGQATTAASLQCQHAGGWDAFVVRIHPDLPDPLASLPPEAQGAMPVCGDLAPPPPP